MYSNKYASISILAKYLLYIICVELVWELAMIYGAFSSWALLSRWYLATVMYLHCFRTLVSLSHLILFVYLSHLIHFGYRSFSPCPICLSFSPHPICLSFSPYPLLLSFFLAMPYLSIFLTLSTTDIVLSRYALFVSYSPYHYCYRSLHALFVFSLHPICLSFSHVSVCPSFPPYPNCLPFSHCLIFLSFSLRRYHISNVYLSHLTVLVRVFSLIVCLYHPSFLSNFFISSYLYVFSFNNIGQYFFPLLYNLYFSLMLKVHLSRIHTVYIYIPSLMLNISPQPICLSFLSSFSLYFLSHFTVCVYIILMWS